MALQYPSPCEGRALFVRWERTGLTDSYRLERSLDGPIGEAAALIYEGEALSFTDHLPPGTHSIQYRLTDSGGGVQLGELLAVRQSQPPRFLTAGRNLGKRSQPFSIPYEAEDPFPEALLSVQVKLDETLLETSQGLYSPVRLAAAVGEGAFAALKDGSSHILKVTIQNEFGQSASLSFPFTVSADETAGCTFYLLRDGVPIAKQTGSEPFFDYGAAGSHRYQVRLVDQEGGFCDSNEVTVTSRMESALLAPLAHLDQMIPLALQSGEAPLHQSLLKSGGQRYLFEGREYAALEDGGQRSQAFTLRALLSEEDYQRVCALLEEGEPILYRDPYGNCITAAVDLLSASLSAQGVALEIQLTRLDETGEVRYD